ncbi:MAG: AI-2E family transporter [Lentisphaerae bacterium]|jgi:predicted PurR-regulated permease PerM|nr:AI-2E family transporter [Lentisphaerota bacterium]MBT4819007.1 AI-2E family transporter [Lentisphaerota bacterium]MBT5607264.1 AI-2E family transporter [Lentisphaerota bacterium]MBT7058807.1 AI-2E family transporter [Lentisphaerota bacterium]MBT7842383.1 AI-2E family transporter [Lentisphaerota bacterium]
MNRWRSKRVGQDVSQASHEARYLMIALTAASVFGVYVILRPFLHSIILALLLVSIFAPVHQRIRRGLSEHENAAAFLAVLVVFLLVLIPFSLFLSGLVKQGIDSIQKTNAWFAEGKFQEALSSERVQAVLAHKRVERLRELAGPYLAGEEGKSVDVGAMALRGGQKALEFVQKGVLPLLQAGGSAVFGFFIMLFVMFFAFRDGAKMLASVLHLSPLSSSQESALLDRIREVSRAVLLGTFITAAAQGLAAMVGFKIVGIPALFWGAMLGATSLVPMVGTALVWVPAVAYLLITGHNGKAVFLALWCLLVVGSIDNFLRPVLMGGRVGMSTVVIFFAILGGIRCFGPVGIIYGPLIFGLCAVSFYIYELENASFLALQDKR